MIRRRLEQALRSRRLTLLGVGPMSKNCVDAVIGLANEHEAPVMLIASRRQIDAEAFGGGYVNNWSTERFADYVIDQDKKGHVVLARDHGGPWQSTFEVQQEFSLRRAMETAKESFRVDIESGFQVIHIDPSVDIHGCPGIEEVLQRVFELYEFCWSVAQRNSRDIIFEVGTEEQSGSTNSSEELEYTLTEIIKFCGKQRLPNPSFIVTQTGTRVMEMRNVGSFDSPLRIADELPAEIQVPKMVEICNRHDVWMKEHNTDYLSDTALAWHPKLGIHSANVAPEFGVIETRALLSVLKEQNMSKLTERFLEISFASDKWTKWMLPDTQADDRDRAVIAGHYVFADPRVVELKREANERLESAGIDLEGELRRQVRQGILRYMKLFRIVDPT